MFEGDELRKWWGWWWWCRGGGGGGVGVYLEREWERIGGVEREGKQRESGGVEREMVGGGGGE